MSKTSPTHRTRPSDTTGMPSGIPYIISNEAAERFSFYGMKAALAIFLANYLGVLGGSNLNESQATSYVSYFNFSVYLTPLLGAFIADLFFGKYRTIVTLSVIYCLGHLCLAFMGLGGVVQFWLLTGLGLIALGAGGIKPCVSAHVGDQFGEKNSHLLTKIFNIFYLSINVGAVISNLAIPFILKWHGPHWAFGIPGVLMALATIFFWMGRQKFVHIPADRASFVKELFSSNGILCILKLIPLYLFVAIFWCLFDQTASTLVFQAEKMNLNLLGYSVLPSQIQAFNPFLIIVLIPIFTFIFYPTVSKFIPLTPLKKIGTGLFLMVLSFAVISWVQEAIDRGETPHIVWQLLAYLIFTSAEILISIVCLEFSYTQAPPKMKSVVMGFFLASVAIGNLITGVINDYIRIDETALESPPAEHIKQAEILQNLYLKENKFPQNLSLNNAPEDDAPLTYQLLHAKSARISSPGKDGIYKTSDDLNTIVSLSKDSELDPNSWLYKEKKKKDLLVETDSNNPLSVKHKLGGGNKLEGAAYFWFFTKLMLVTAILFVPYALTYKGKTYLQE